MHLWCIKIKEEDNEEEIVIYMSLKSVGSVFVLSLRFLFIPCYCLRFWRWTQSFYIYYIFTLYAEFSFFFHFLNLDYYMLIFTKKPILDYLSELMKRKIAYTNKFTSADIPMYCNSLDINSVANFLSSYCEKKIFVVTSNILIIIGIFIWESEKTTFWHTNRISFTFWQIVYFCKAIPEDNQIQATYENTLRCYRFPCTCASYLRYCVSNSLKYSQPEGNTRYNDTIQRSIHFIHWHEEKKTETYALTRIFFFEEIVIRSASYSSIIFYYTNTEFESHIWDSHIWKSSNLLLFIFE